MAKADNKTTVAPYRRDELGLPRRWRLRVVAGAAVGRVVEYDGTELFIGRDPECQLRLTDTGVSRRHAKVMQASDGTGIIVDLESTNGTLVNDARVELAPLRPGYRVRIGPIAELVCETVDAGTSPKLQLTQRELEIARLVVSGRTNPEIAAQLGIRPRTVGTHLENIYRRLEIGSRAELAIWLVQAGLA